MAGRHLGGVQGFPKRSPHPTPASARGARRSIAQCLFTAGIQTSLQHRKHKSAVSVAKKVWSQALAKRSLSLQELLAAYPAAWHPSVIPRSQTPITSSPRQQPEDGQELHHGTRRCSGAGLSRNERRRRFTTGSRQPQQASSAKTETRKKQKIR